METQKSSSKLNFGDSDNKYLDPDYIMKQYRDYNIDEGVKNQIISFKNKNNSKNRINDVDYKYSTNDISSNFNNS